MLKFYLHLDLFSIGGSKNHYLGGIMNRKSGIKPSPSQPIQNLLSWVSLFQNDFSIDWIVYLLGEKASQVLLELDEAVKNGWLIKKGPHIFGFRNEEDRNKFNFQVSTEDKERMIKRIIECLMEDLPEDDEKALALSPYLVQIKNDLEKCRWLMKAAEINYRSARYDKALSYYKKVLSDLADLKGVEADSLYATAAIQYSKISLCIEDTTKIYFILKHAIDRAKNQNDFKSLALLEMHLAKNEWLRSKDQIALKHFEQGWSLAKSIGDPKLLRAAITLRIHCLNWLGKFLETVKSYEASVPNIERFPHGQFPLFTGLMIAYCYFQVGQVSQGLGMMDAIRIHCLERNDRYLEAQALFTIAASMMDLRNLNEAFQFSEKSMEMASRSRNGWVQIMGKLILSLLYFLRGDHNQAITNLNGFLEKSINVLVLVRPYPYFLELLWAMEEGKLQKVAGLSLKRELYRIQRGENIFLKGLAFRYQALLDKRENMPWERIMQDFSLSLRYLEEAGSVIELARTKIEMAREFLNKGDEERAKEIVMAASKSFAPFNIEFIPEDVRPIIKQFVASDDILKEVLKFGQKIVSIREPKDLAQSILSSINSITGAERSAIFILEEVNFPRITLHASKNLTPDEVKHPNFLTAMKMIEEVASTGKGRILKINPIKKNHGSSSEIISARICVPMVLRNKVMGVLYLDNRLLPNIFKEDDFELLEYFAGLAAIAMDNSRAYEEIKKLNQKLKEEKNYFEEQHFQNLHFEDIIGESSVIKAVLSKVYQVAKTDTSVLITGETGVGKELVARAIHRHSLRREKPFIRVFCSAFPESLIPSELFGHEKGAFTGAIHRRIGRFELADGGTIFLDEIGDLPFEVQTRLLRVLQNKEFERVGGTETIRSDFRLVAATNKNLEQAMKYGKFRADLYYRINVFPIHVPPLRDRKEDIPLLSLYFLKIYEKKMGKSFDGIPSSEMDKLIKYDWPGNVRELENIIERGVILSGSPAFRVPELGINSINSIELSQAPRNATLDEVERQYIIETLQKTFWKIRGKGGAAEILNIHPSTLAFRMKKLGIKKPLPLSRATMKE